jgi:excisionase family DNA binding protein
MTDAQHARVGETSSIAGFLALSRTDTSHLVVALQRYLKQLSADGKHTPPALKNLTTSLLNGLSAGLCGSPVDGFPQVLDDDPMPPKVLRLDAVARVLSSSRSTVKRLVERGELPTMRVLGDPRIRVSDVDAYIARQPSQSLKEREIG